MKNPDNWKKFVDKVLHLSPTLFLTLVLTATLASSCDSKTTSTNGQPPFKEVPTSTGQEKNTSQVWDLQPAIDQLQQGQ